MDVTFPDGNRYTANVIANDIYSDIAVLQVSQNVSKPLKPLVLGNSSEVDVGDTLESPILSGIKCTSTSASDKSGKVIDCKCLSHSEFRVSLGAVIR